MHFKKLTLTTILVILSLSYSIGQNLTNKPSVTEKLDSLYQFKVYNLFGDQISIDLKGANDKQKNKSLEHNVPVKIYYSLKSKGTRSRNIEKWVYPTQLSDRLDQSEDDLDLLGLNNLDLAVQKTLNKKDSLIKKIDFRQFDEKGVQTRISYISDSLDNAVDTIFFNHATSNPNSYLAVYAFINYANRPADRPRIRYQITELQALLNAQFHLLKGKTIDKINKQLSNAKRTEIGKYLPKITLADSLGKKSSLSGVKGHYTLIDFWATWCGYCRVEHPNLIDMHNKYPNLKIISVSLDETKSIPLWKQAILNDGINKWPQYIASYDDAKQYLNINAIPANFLLDAEGRIIDFNLRGEKLEIELKKIFKY
jgi:thiol-disulfide isomerase/thioredoxin